jgi:class 3 adenylate cyclase
MQNKRSNIGFGLRLKIILTFFIISSAIGIYMSVSSYNILNRQLFKELQGRVKNLSILGVRTIDVDSLKRLIMKMTPEYDKDISLTIEQSQDYKIISDQLNFIRNVEKKLIRYTYIIIPTTDGNTVKYAVDADVISLNCDKNAKNDDNQISHFNSTLDVSGYLAMRKSIEEKVTTIDDSYLYDPVFKFNSISGYSPIFDNDGSTLIAVLGLDMADIDVRTALNKAATSSVIVAVIALVISIVVSVFLGTLFTRSIVYLDRIVRRFSEKDMEVRADIKSKDEVGRLGLSFNLMAQTIQSYSRQLEELLAAYARFVPKDFLKFLEKESIVDLKLGDQVQRDMTVLFSDIRSFTMLSESMTPKENFNFINSFLSRVGPEIRSHNGFIDKYIGDAVMALFPDKADDAIDAGIAMQLKLVEYNVHRAKNGYQKISIGVGIHSGSLMLGTVGEMERMDGTVISDVVNLSSRLEGLTKKYGVSVLISESTLNWIRNREKYAIRFLDRVQVKGKNKPVTIYEVMNSLDENVRKLKMELSGYFDEALNKYYEGDFKRAMEQFYGISGKSPEDKLYGLYIERCKYFIKNGIPENWDGVEVFDSK